MHYLAVGPECAAASLCGSENFFVKLDGGICVGSNKIRRDRVISFWNFLHCGTHWEPPVFLSRLAFLRLGWSRGRAETEFSDSDPKVSTREMAPVERAEVTNSPHEIVFEFFMPIHPTFGQDLSATACVTVQAGCPTAGMQRLRAL